MRTRLFLLMTVGCSAATAIDETSSSRTRAPSTAAASSSTATASATPSASSTVAPAGAASRGLREIARHHPLVSYGDVGVTAALPVGDGVLALGWYRGVGKGTLRGAIGFDMFASRLDAGGKETMTQNLGGAVIVDASKRGDDVFVAGEVLGTFTIGPVDGKPLGSIDAKVLGAIVARYDADANGSWLAIPDTKDVEHARGVAVAADGDVVLAGQLFGRGRPGTTQLSSRGGADGFVVRVSSAGKLVSRAAFGTSSDDDVLGVAIDGSGAAYVAGITNTFAGISYAGGGGFDPSKPSSALVAKIDAAGKIVWQKELGADVSAGATAIAAHPKGGVVVGGFTRGPIPALGVDPAGAAHAMFVVRLDAAGAASEARTFALPAGCALPREQTSYPRFLPALRAGGIEAQFFPVTGSPFAPTDVAVAADGTIAIVGVDTCGGRTPAGPRDGFVALVGDDGRLVRAAARAPRAIEPLPDGKWLVADDRDVVIFGPP